jgi:hypothetical protein
MFADRGTYTQRASKVDVPAGIGNARSWRHRRVNTIGSYLLGFCAALALLAICIQPASAQQSQSAWSQIEHTIVVGPSGPLLPAPLPDFTLTGFYLNNSGFFVNADNLRKSQYPYFQNNPKKLFTVTYFLGHNDLSTERNNIQLDLNWDVNENNHLYARFWGVYEPAYPIEYTGRQHFNTDFYNQYNLHEAWWKSRMGPVTLFLGQQIVTWGESLAFRVNDIVNPQDTSWAFGFSNLEQSRQALWMAHPVINLPSWGMLQSNFLEILLIPALQPKYTNVWGQVHGEYGVNHDNVAGGLNTGAPISPVAPLEAGGNPAAATFARFAPRSYPYVFGFACGPTIIKLGKCAQPQLYQPLGNTSPPLIPLDRNNLNTGSMGGLGGAPLDQNNVPMDTWASTEVGGRLHTLLGDTEMTATYFYGHTYSGTWETYNTIGRHGCPGGVPPVKGICAATHTPPFFNLNAHKQVSPSSFHAIFPHINEMGLSANRPLYGLPGWLASLPLTARTEGLITDRAPFNTTDPSILKSMTYAPTLQTLVALDLNRAYVPILSQTGSLNGNFEWNNTALIAGTRNVTAVSPSGGHLAHNESNFLLALGDSWYWGAFAPTFIGIYNPDATTFLLFPNINLTPPWTDKYFFNVKYINILGNNKLRGAGVLKGKQMFLGAFQYNFTLM